MAAPHVAAFDYSSLKGETDPKRVPAMLRPYLRDLEHFTLEELALLRWKLMWKSIAREKQLPPREFEDFIKTIWGIRSGRGFGKTLSAANWMGDKAASSPMPIMCAVVAPTHDDVRYTCFEGVTGLLAVIPPVLIKDTNAGLPSITLFNNSFLRGFSGDNPERLRGPQHHVAWCDEIASWRYPDDAWDNLWFGLRLGKHPQVVWTGTPKPTPFMRKLVVNKSSVVTVGTTYENRENLTQTFYDNVAKYEGTKIGRQELLGEILDPEEEGIVRRSWWRMWPADKKLPKFRMIVMSLDTAFTEYAHDKKKQSTDPTACSVWGLFDLKGEEHVILLDCWEDWLGLPDLIKRVKKERKFTYGDADEPMLRPRIVRPEDRPRHTGKSVDIILIEEKGSGISLRQALAKENVMTTPYNPNGMDKLSRLHVTSPMWAHRRVWAPESEVNPGNFKAWAEPLIGQICSFTGEGSVEHDDLLDTTTQAMKLIMDKHVGAMTEKRDLVEEKRQAARQQARRALQPKNPYMT